MATRRGQRSVLLTLTETGKCLASRYTRSGDTSRLERIKQSAHEAPVHTGGTPHDGCEHPSQVALVRKAGIGGDAREGQVARHEKTASALDPDARAVLAHRTAIDAAKDSRQMHRMDGSVTCKPHDRWRLSAAVVQMFDHAREPRRPPALSRRPCPHRRRHQFDRYRFDVQSVGCEVTLV